MPNRPLYFFQKDIIEQQVTDSRNHNFGGTPLRWLRKKAPGSISTTRASLRWLLVSQVIAVVGVAWVSKTRICYLWVHWNQAFRDDTSNHSSFLVGDVKHRSGRWDGGSMGWFGVAGNEPVAIGDWRSPPDPQHQARPFWACRNNKGWVYQFMDIEAEKTCLKPWDGIWWHEK